MMIASRSSPYRRCAHRLHPVDFGGIARVARGAGIVVWWYSVATATPPPSANPHRSSLLQQKKITETDKIKTEK